MRLLIFAFSLFILVGCKVADSIPKTIVTKSINSKPNQFILLCDSAYEGDLSMALMENGFTVKPIPLTQAVVELETPTKIIKYNEAGYRYALKISIRHNYRDFCVFSGGHLVDVTMTVIDISSNETLAIIQQNGPDRKCPPLTPVWTLLAKELKRILVTA
jgi:hypothetical protein